MSSYVSSFYAAQHPPRPVYADQPPQSGVDVVVVGGGLAGLTTAHELATKGKTVLICESHRVGWGASGRNGGFVSAGFAEGIAALEKKLGFDHAKALYDLSATGVDYVRDTITASDQPSLIQGQGYLELVRHPLDKKTIVANLASEARYGTPGRALARADLSAYVSSDAYHCGFLSDDAFHIDPLAYANLLAKKARSGGVFILEETPVTDVQKQSGFLTVVAGRNRIKTQHVVFAGSAYLSDVGGPVRRAVLPVATYVVTTEPLGDRIDAAIRFKGCIADTRRAGDYYRRIADNRLLWGGRITTQRAEPTTLAHLMSRDILSVYPQLGPVKIDNAWSGLMGYCLHKMPLIASLGGGLWVNTGFGGHGLNTTAMGGIVIAEAILGNDDPLRLFAPFKARWGGGPVGRLATQAAYWAFQLGDAWDERKKPLPLPLA